MTRQEKAAQFSRRAMLKAGGALVVSIGMPIGLDTVLDIGQAFAQGATKPPLTPDQLSSYIAVNADGTVSAFFGKMDMGQGLFVAIGQMVAEELDVPFKAVTVIMGDTATSVNQGGASGSTGIQLGGKQMLVLALLEGCRGKGLLKEGCASTLLTQFPNSVFGIQSRSTAVFVLG
jgi:nicotinate dehydrogenase subunit B